ncbi:MAG: iron ABC transporter permease, partial [Bacteroidota bacterium]
PLAEPYILGVSSGASAGAAVLYLGFLPAGAAGFITLPLAAFLGSLLALGLAYGVARVGPVLSTTRLLLAGVAIAALLSAITSFLIFASPQPEKLQTLLFWLLGSFSSARWEFVPLPLICTVLGASVLTLWARPLDALLVGEEPAQSLGIPVETLKRLLIAGTALLTGVAVASAGVIGFVGLIVPHATRFLVGVTHRRLVPSAALGGAVFLILADVVARTLLAGRELPIGIITAVCGVPFFLVLLRRS